MLAVLFLRKTTPQVNPTLTLHSPVPSGLGSLIQLVGQAVLHGFITASALLMIFSQTSLLLGMPKCSAADLHGVGHEFDECFMNECGFNFNHLYGAGSL
jgi:hypothetical protein